MKGKGRGKKFSGVMVFKKFFEGRGGDFEEKFFLMMVSEKFFFRSSCAEGAKGLEVSRLKVKF